MIARHVTMSQSGKMMMGNGFWLALYQRRPTLPSIKLSHREKIHQKIRNHFNKQLKNKKW